ncbi:DMT family transporter [Geomonas sp. Red32]|uniref:DMT family transporter n=1 Tax=Geomonas sp. Red32 TaxID=2912856 RepID=UPI00202CD724|nr:DMT family transporter [Geomonas sp. Red32]MCM0083013.1 DMT family transporter [Geomonas sp. Red32]
MPANDTQISSSKATFWLVLSTFFWGGSFIFNKIGFRDIPPVTFLFFRFALAALVMGGVCLPRLKKLNLVTLKTGLLVGFALAATNVSFVLGVSGTSASRAGFLNNLFVLIIPLFCFMLWREKMDRWTVAGLFMAMAGMWQLAYGGVEGFNRGDVLSTLCALFIAFHIISVSKLLTDEDIYLVTLVQFATVAAVGGVLYAILPAEPFSITAASGGSLVYCAIFPTVVAFTLMNTYQRFTTPTKAGLIYTLDPVWSMVGGMLILGERLSPGELFGCALIFGAVVLPLSVKRLRERHVRLAYAE